ncbi:SDR family NAD(P)-dependent oxidoreductase [Catenuloplanes atrovinosus]|uniref:NAD(P)-dependent dehydrogenase (Short-subunit alcohol dehydrogenase family) n=1 Tax=Catenuloplanes atrovinosus TaxID=137266 RepID=A0AAE3YMG5_9ACTN|nr:SDR family NAD(P)-dependent oxidoreductase [Catenuloplanes atrovinosus]MDR7274551.1 NAD(P)-dependent dehydrogenase (short-subunit alcohol dehydrogenase family) [Catenuloplanes atrovinosus]
MDLELTGKRVLVTGASKGLGLGIVRAFLGEGAEVVAVARRGTAELDATGATFVAADLARADGPRRMVDAVLAGDGRLDVLVNNAGGGELPDDAFGDTFDGDDDVWSEVVAFNLLSVVRVTRAALPALTASRGAVVNIGSNSARVPGAAPLPYAAAKAALAMVSRGLAERLAASGVRVNTVSPAGVRSYTHEGPDGYTARLAAHLGMDHATLLEALPRQGGMLTGRLAEPDEIARAVLLLASPTLPSAIGQNWSIDAGAVKTT